MWTTAATRGPAEESGGSSPLPSAISKGQVRHYFYAIKKDKKSFSKTKSFDTGKTTGDRKRKRANADTTADKTEQKRHKRSKPHMKLVEDMKSSWNVVRMKSIPKSERDEVVSRMVTKLQGHLLQVCGIVRYQHCVIYARYLFAMMLAAPFKVCFSLVPWRSACKYYPK